MMTKTNVRNYVHFGGYILKIHTWLVSEWTEQPTNERNRSEKKTTTKYTAVRDKHTAHTRSRHNELKKKETKKTFKFYFCLRISTDAYADADANDNRMRKN